MLDAVFYHVKRNWQGRYPGSFAGAGGGERAPGGAQRDLLRFAEREHVRAARRQDPLLLCSEGGQATFQSRKVASPLALISAWAIWRRRSGSRVRPAASPPTQSQLGLLVARRARRRAARSVRKGQVLWHLRCWRPRQGPS